MPRPEITWFKDGIELYHHKYFQVSSMHLLFGMVEDSNKCLIFRFTSGPKEMTRSKVKWK